MEKKRLLDLFLIILVLLIVFGFFGVFKKTCDSEECFSEGIKNCRNLVYFQDKEGNLLRYSVSNVIGYCIVDIRMERVSGSLESVEMLEGEEMTCKIPKKELDMIGSNMESYIKYCNGILKEKMYELVLKKMYGVVISNIDDVINEVRENSIE